MPESTVNPQPLASLASRLVRRLLVIGDNRLELLAVEVQENRNRLLHAFILALAAAAFSLLAGITLTAAIVVWLWASSPLIVLLALTSLYAATAFWLGRRLNLLLRDWQTLPATLDQIKKDRACLEKILE